jgi:hypothetical protein
MKEMLDYLGNNSDIWLGYTVRFDRRL